MKHEAVRRIQFCAGHRVYNHESKCRNLHGHNYVLYAHAVPKHGLDQLGRVIDFSELKIKLGTWIDENWDHGFIHLHNDDDVITALRLNPGQKAYSMKTNPTAENMAEHLLKDICPVLFQETDIRINKIVLWETENCFVEVTLDA